KHRDSLLHRHSDIASIDRVMKEVTEDGKFNDLPNNATFLTTLQLAKTTSYDYSGLTYLTEKTGRYLVLIEENEHQYPWISLRVPSDGHHDVPLLRDVISEILECHLKTIGERKEFMLDSDTVAMESVLDILGRHKYVKDGEFAYFHMDDKQCAEYMKIAANLPDGFIAKSIEEKDFQFVIDKWEYCDSHELMRQRLRHLPSSAIYRKEGQIASFATSHTMGQMNHLYTPPEFRGIGLGKLTE
ncbi:hypothetical protein PFISCL1PPCAC_11653, partial [Pristionchus fissidentatus]